VIVDEKGIKDLWKEYIEKLMNEENEWDHRTSAGVKQEPVDCISKQKSVHKKCNGIKGSISKVMKSFVCRGCLNPVTSTDHTTVDIGGSANLELLDKFCYLGDMLSVDGDADAAVDVRIRIGWNKFGQRSKALLIIDSEREIVQQ